MREDARDAVLLKLVGELRGNGSWCGETHVQKATYFLQELHDVPLALPFILYKHGPFSFELRDELSSLRVNRFLTAEAAYPYGARLNVSEAGELALSRFPKALALYGLQISLVAERLGSKKVDELERLATALYVRKIEGLQGKEEVARRIVQLKPHVPVASARKATKTVQAWIQEVEG